MGHFSCHNLGSQPFFQIDAISSIMSFQPYDRDSAYALRRNSVNVVFLRDNWRQIVLQLKAIF